MGCPGSYWHGSTSAGLRNLIRTGMILVIQSQLHIFPAAIVATKLTIQEGILSRTHITSQGVCIKSMTGGSRDCYIMVIAWPHLSQSCARLRHTLLCNCSLQG